MHALAHLPLIVYGFDDEAQRRADGVDVLVHDFFDDGRLPGIVETAALVSENAKIASLLRRGLQHEDPHLLILQPGFSEDGQHLAGRATERGYQMHTLFASAELRWRAFACGWEVEYSEPVGCRNRRPLVLATELILLGSPDVHVMHPTTCHVVASSTRASNHHDKPWQPDKSRSRFPSYVLGSKDPLVFYANCNSSGIR